MSRLRSGNLTTSGALTIADVDQGQSNFAAQAGTPGSTAYGTFTLAADGNWTYTADNSQTAIQQLGAGQSITDSFTAVSSDGTASQLVTVTINGTNDVPVIGGVHIGAVTEDVAVIGPATSPPAAHSPSPTSIRASPTSQPRPAPPAQRYGTFTLEPPATGPTPPTTARPPSSSSAPASRSPTASPPSPATAPPASSSPSPSTAPTTCR